MEAILKRFKNGNIMLILRIFRKGRQNIRVYDDYIEICPTVDDFNFLKEDLPLFFWAVNRANNDARARRKSIYLT